MTKPAVCVDPYLKQLSSRITPQNNLQLHFLATCYIYCSEPAQLDLYCRQQSSNSERSDIRFEAGKQEIW
jgi:hypothetical protein